MVSKKSVIFAVVPQLIRLTLLPQSIQNHSSKDCSQGENESLQVILEGLFKHW